MLYIATLTYITYVLMVELQLHLRPSFVSASSKFIVVSFRVKKSSYHDIRNFCNLTSLKPGHAGAFQNYLKSLQDNCLLRFLSNYIGFYTDFFLGKFLALSKIQ